MIGHEKSVYIGRHLKFEVQVEHIDRLKENNSHFSDDFAQPFSVHHLMKSDHSCVLSLVSPSSLTFSLAFSFEEVYAQSYKTNNKDLRIINTF